MASTEHICMFAATVAPLRGCNAVLDLGGGDLPTLASLAARDLDTMAVDFGCGPRPDGYGAVRWLERDSFLAGLEGGQPSALNRTLVLCLSALDGAGDVRPIMAALTRLTRQAPLTIVRATPRRLREMAAEGMTPAFVGSAGSSAGDRRIALFDPSAPGMNSRPKVPDKFKVIAFVTAYNEGDIIRSCLEHLVSQGVSPYLIDNWSTDDTWMQARSVSGLAGFERYPQSAPSATFSLRRLLTRIEDLARQIEAAWFIHVDADELRFSCWEHLSLREALYCVDAAGYNVVDHTCLGFPPVDDGWAPGMSLEEHFRFFEFAQMGSDYTQRKAWKRIGGLRASLAANGGHDVTFAGRRLYPYKFISKHYPIRSQSHGERKVFSERQARYDPEERMNLGWHSHYNVYRPGCSFLRSKDELIEWNSGFFPDHLMARLSGIGAGQERFLSLPRPVRSVDAVAAEQADWGRFHVDRCNDVVEPFNSQPLLLPASQGIQLAGWAVDARAATAAYGVEVALDGKVYGALYGGWRQDVADAFGNPNYLLSGFSVRIPSSLVGLGKHSVRVRVVLSGGDRYVEGGPLEIVLAEDTGCEAEAQSVTQPSHS